MIIEVRLKTEFADAPGLEVMRTLQGLGLKSIHGVSSSQLYDIRGSFTKDQINKAAVRLLCDPVTQEYKIIKGDSPLFLRKRGTVPGNVPMISSVTVNSKFGWRVEVWLKSSVTDTVGESVGFAIEDIGLPKPNLVRYGLAYCVDCGCSKTALEKAVRKSIVNPLIQNCSIS